MPLSAPLPVAQKSGTTLTTFTPVTSGGTTAQAYQLAALNSAGQFDPSLVVVSGGSGTGTVTSVATTGGITGGPITTTGTVSLSSLTSQSLLGNPTAGAATPISVPIGAGLTFSGGNLVATATGGGVDGLWWYG